MLLQGDVTQRTTLLTRFKYITLFPQNPYLYYQRFLSFLQCLRTAAPVIIGNKTIFIYVYVWKTIAMGLQGFFIWSAFNVNLFFNSQK